MAHSKYTSATCEICDTLFESLPFEDENALPLTACPACGQKLCPCCAQFHCDGCGDVFCSTHVVLVPDGTPKPLRCCQACAAECEPCELPAAIPPQSERRPILHEVEVA